MIKGNISMLNKRNSWHCVFSFNFGFERKTYMKNTSKRLQHVILPAHDLTFFSLKFFLSFCVKGEGNDWHINVLDSQQTILLQKCHSHFITLVKRDKSWKCHLPSKVRLPLSIYFIKKSQSVLTKVVRAT